MKDISIYSYYNYSNPGISSSGGTKILFLGRTNFFLGGGKCSVYSRFKLFVRLETSTRFGCYYTPSWRWQKGQIALPAAVTVSKHIFSCSDLSRERAWSISCSLRSLCSQRGFVLTRRISAQGHEGEIFELPRVSLIATVIFGLFAISVAIELALLWLSERA